MPIRRNMLLDLRIFDTNSGRISAFLFPAIHLLAGGLDRCRNRSLGFRLDQGR